MTLSTLDVKPALVVIDLQKGVVGIPAVHPTEEIVHQAATLAAAFRKHSLPVVLVTVTGVAPGRAETARLSSYALPTDWTELVDELRVQPGDYLMTKQRRSAFHDTSLHADLRAIGVSQIVRAGVSTTSGVESTGRAAYDHGCNVVLATDATTDSDADAHDNSV